MRIIDADGHVLERDIPWADLIDAPYRSRAPRAVQDNRGYPFIMIDGKLTPKPVGKGCSFVGAPRSHSKASIPRCYSALRLFSACHSSKTKISPAPLRASTTTGWRNIAARIRGASRA